MTTEEKAKLYDEAFERAKIYYSTTGSVADTELIELLFPELKESENDDERTRKELIRAFQSLNTIDVWNGIKRNDIIAWLEKQKENIDNANKEYWRGYREGKQAVLDKYAEVEKQGEQKPDDKVEPKFKEVIGLQMVITLGK